MFASGIWNSKARVLGRPDFGLVTRTGADSNDFDLPRNMVNSADTLGDAMVPGS